MIGAVGIGRIYVMDTISQEKRSEVMRRVKSKNSKAEMVVRRLAHSLGYRYRLHIKALPGQPDLVFAKRRKVIFVHGCLWHGHQGCKNNRRPSSHQEYWEPKLDGNIKRDKAHLQQLAEMGWNTLVIWECETKDRDELLVKIQDFLEGK